jgi:DNA-binding response OmpR family regulator
MAAVGLGVVRREPAELQLEALEAAAAELVRLRTAEHIEPVAAAAARDGLGAKLIQLALLSGREVRGRLVAHVARSGEPLFLPDTAAVPLAGAEETLGVLVLERPRGFTLRDRSFLMALAGLCALAVERLRTAGGLRLGAMRIDMENLRIDVHGRSAHLTPSELRLLMFLAEQPGRARSRREILQHLWDTEHVEGERACDAHIWNLRRKIERDPSRPRLVVTRRGVGYALLVP